MRKNSLFSLYTFRTMVMETPGPQEVGREFVRQYYTMLHEAPLHLHRFYSNNSAFVHGGVEKAGNEQPPVIGQEAIHKKIVSLNFNDCHAKIRQVDAQATVEDSVVVQVTGELSNNGEPMRRFMQTFVLVPQTPKKFYVHNDIFRYQDEVFHDDDGEVDDSDRFITDPRDAMDNGQDQAPQSPVVSSPYYEQVPLSNGPALEEPLKVPEPSPVHIQAPPVSQKQEVEIVPVVEREQTRVEEVLVPEEKFEHKSYEPKAESKPAVTEPVQQEFNEPQPGPKPVTWAALASKNTPGGVAPPQSSYPPPPVSHAAKPPPSRTEPPKQDGVSSQPPQSQRAPRAPRERYVDRERNSVSRGDGDGDADSVNGRRSNSVGGGGSKYADNQQLFVGNLPLNITEAELKEFFEQYGRVEELRINTKSGGGKVPNFGFVVFESPEIVQEVLKLKANQSIKYKGEHRLNVEEKKPRDGLRGGNRGMSRGGGMGGQGMGRSSGPPYGNDRGGPGGRGNIKSGSGFNNRQDMRGSPNRGGMSQGRR
ncbi:ras GTPase-activating protein-binding protein 2 [Biomphalaria glabrata]|uniref:Ras GTPase-activating protein-binding protein 2-like isoform X1 n=2 Tax=Biomphalaria glabrata TaxID=6526 RepID=A0A9W2ZJ91_BIOGL|nr:ras GTPase-activating protein-binding protein 2-like isoform X1 [Biomphalaria glabrata]KAI8766707.1 ras GTPase-activating protein-binding protein 2-like [Biomphalaria glabrata]